MVLSALPQLPEVRNRPLKRRRMQFQETADLEREEGEFAQLYRMPYDSFMRLVNLLRHRLLVDDQQSRNRTGTDPATPETVLACGLRHLAGGSYHDVRRIYRISRPHYYSCVWKVVHAINGCAALDPQFPSTRDEREAMARGFNRLSSSGLFTRCIGCIDGWLCPIKVPRSDEVNRVASFFSGHYQRVGINVQVCCDYNARVTSFTIKSAGAVNDSQALAEWGLLHELRDASRDCMYVIADNGYPQTRYILTPFNALEMQRVRHRYTYNCYLSEVRAVVERTFGLMVGKWRILGRELYTKFDNHKHVIEACIRLHNFCIDERISTGRFSLRQEVEETTAWNGEPLYYPQFTDAYDTPEPPSTLNHVIREAIVQEVETRGLTAPQPRPATLQT
eukprot:GHVU01209270.1.p1 GENE.GHVU01209270.1~~GHVU01209270.1.p1  ORF type:complete len:392 (+),score=25.39 GHVU01209270.1:1466-2641(+)